MAKASSVRAKTGRRTSSSAPRAPTAAGATPLGQVEEDDDLPLLESMQELIKREKLALEYQLVEKDETILVLKEKCKALEKTTSAHEEHKEGKGGRRRHWPGAVREENMPLVVDHHLALSNRGLNVRRLAIVNKQFKFLKKQVDGIRLDGNGLDDTCLEGVLELLHTRAVAYLDLSGNNFGHKGGSMLLACLRSSRELGEKLEVLRLQTNGTLAALPGFGADISRVLKELWDKKVMRKLWWLSLTLQDYQSSGLGKAAAGGAKAAAGGNKPGTGGGASKLKKAKDPLNALVLAKFMKSKEKQQLAVLELRHARLCPKTVEALSHVECLRSLTHLDLCNAMIGAAGAQALARSLVLNVERVSLTSLSLPGNCIADFGTSALAKAVAVSQTITALDLRNNYMGDRGASDLLAAIEANRSLMTNLRLSHNRFSSSIIVKCLRLARLPGSALTHVDLSGHAGAVLLRSDLDEALAANSARIRGQCLGVGSTSTDVIQGPSAGPPTTRSVLSWKRSHLARESFRNAGKDLHVRLLHLSLTDSHLDFSPPDEHGSYDYDTRGGSREQRRRRPGVVVVRMVWFARRVPTVVADGDEEEEGGGQRERSGAGDGKSSSIRFLWKVCRERNGDTTVLARGNSRGNGSSEGWQSFEASFTGVCGGDQLYLQFCACDRSQVPLQRQVLGEMGGEIQVRGLSVQSCLDERYGLLSEVHMHAPQSEAEELMVQYSERNELRLGGSQAQRQQVRKEMWKLFLEMGDGRYYCLQELFVGSGPDVRLSWEAWVEDEHDGVPLAFSWAITRRSFGSSEVAARGQAPAREACWVPMQATISGCLPGDVLVIWLGVPDKEGARHSSLSSSGTTTMTRRQHAVAPYIRDVQLFLVQSEEDRAVMLRQRRAMPACVLYGAGTPVQTVERNIAWGF